MFNNGNGRPGGNYSTVETFQRPAPVNFQYELGPGAAFPPPEANWIYMADPPSSMYSNAVSGAQRLANGNTLICVGMSGLFLEIDSTKTVVWKYVNPVGVNGPTTQGSMPIGNGVFRCTYYPPDFPAFLGMNLQPGNPIEINPLPSACETGGVVDAMETGKFCPIPFINGPNLSLKHRATMPPCWFKMLLAKRC